jgi:hypothetical protein
MDFAGGGAVEAKMPFLYRSSTGMDVLLMTMLQDLRLETAYEHQLLHMASVQLGWTLRTKEFCARGVHVHGVSGKLAASVSQGVPGPILGNFHVESPAPWIQQFVPVLVTTAHKLLELVLTWIMEESGTPADELTAGKKCTLYLQKLATGSLTVPHFWSHYPAIHDSTVRTWRAFTPVRNDSVHRGGVVLGTWGDLTLRSQTGLRKLTSDEVTAFCLLAIYTIDAIVSDPDTYAAACQRAGVVAALQTLTAVSGVSLPEQPKEYWITSSIYRERAIPGGTIVRWSEICNFAVQEYPPRADEHRRFEVILELSGGGREHKSVRIPSGLLSAGRDLRFEEDSGSWVEV